MSSSNLVGQIWKYMAFLTQYPYINMQYYFIKQHYWEILLIYFTAYVSYLLTVRSENKVLVYGV